MADFDSDFGAFDPNPPGTVTPMGGISNDNPLIDWGSNLKPQDAFQYVHDPDGFIKNRVAEGKPPPDFDHVAGPTGLQAVNRQTGQPITRGGLPSIITGDSLSPPGGVLGQATAFAPGDPPPPRPEDNVSDKYKYKPPAAPAPAPAPAPDSGGPFGVGESKGPLAPVVKNFPRDPAEAKKRLQEPFSKIGGGVGPKPAEAMSAEEEEKLGVPKDKAGYHPAPPLPAPVTVGPRPGEVPKEAPEGDALNPKTPETPDKKKEEDRLSFLAKSLQGVKMPEAPKVQFPGTPSAPHPTAISPTAANLLGLIGQQHPALQTASLMRLLGRAY